ncbi:MAG: acyl carrier protein [Lachnospiraceae bacterium]|nr:acyl carrier protein [Lachnospiraceae bacterium]
MELEKLARIIAEVLNVPEDEITMDTTFVDDLGADSLDLYQIVLGVEEEFNLELSEEALDNIVSVGDAVRLIREEA